MTRICKSILRHAFYSVAVCCIICFIWSASISVYAICKGTGECDETCSNARYSPKHEACKTTGAVGGKCKKGGLSDPNEQCGTCECLPEKKEEDSLCSCKEPEASE